MVKFPDVSNILITIKIEFYIFGFQMLQENKENITSTKIVTALSILSNTLVSSLIILIYFHGNDLWEWAKNTTKITDIVSTLVTCAVFFFGYQISKSQKNIAKENLKLDLFDRRYKIYNIFKNDSVFLSHYLGKDKKDQILQEMDSGVRESFFLFNKDVYKKLHHIYRIFNNLDHEAHTLKMHQQSRSVSQNKDELRNQIKQSVKRMKNYREELDKFYDDIDGLFEKYMSFEDLNIK